MYFQTQIEIDNSELIDELSYELNEWLQSADAVEALPVRSSRCSVSLYDPVRAVAVFGPP